MGYLQQKGRQVLGLILTAVFLSTIFVYGTGGYRAVRGQSLFFTPEMIGTHLESYNEEEKAEIAKDLEVVRSVCFAAKEVAKNLNPKPFYLATAGAPGARKSTILERFMHEHPEYAQAVYLDPDQRTLKFMAHTYYAQSLSALRAGLTGNYLAVQKAAYEKWRAASNYIVLTLLEEAFARRDNIAYGTTSTGAHIPEFLKRLHEANYQTTLLLCSCEDDVRREAIQYRNEQQRFYQSSPEDAVAKGIFFPQRMSAYFTYADVLYIYWSDDLFSSERLAAVLENGKVTVNDAAALEGFTNKYEKDRAALQAEGKTLPAWNELIEMYQARF
jgi:hypothetical protein